MGRPKSGRKGRAVSLYMSGAIIGGAIRRAKESGWSLSEYIERVLNGDLHRKIGIAHRFSRHPGGGPK
ncbi:MAG TPA: hypothetical protein PLU30_17225 [Verrucomicrobiae bacterium]|nr:hypothetical protein [Verrucomicrobiae bacterium]